MLQFYVFFSKHNKVFNLNINWLNKWLGGTQCDNNTAVYGFFFGRAIHSYSGFHIQIVVQTDRLVWETIDFDVLLFFNLYFSICQRGVAFPDQARADMCKMYVDLQIYHRLINIKVLAGFDGFPESLELSKWNSARS